MPIYSDRKLLDRSLAAALVLHILAMFAAFTVLAAAFDFPDVLRYPAAERFASFAANQRVVRPTYWVLTMTGVSQILISVLLFHALGRRASAAATMLLVFGCLAGLCQAFGFARWVIVIPHFIAEAADPQRVLAAEMLEGAFNRYAGMVIGEHLANIFWGIWLAAAGILLIRQGAGSAGLGWGALALAPLLIVLAGEQIGVSGAVLAPLVDFGFPLLAVWHLLLAVQLWRRAGGPRFAALRPGAWMAGAFLGLGMVAAAFT